MKNKEKESIYSPSEDTFLLINTIKQYNTNKALEIGIGSGLVITDLEINNKFVVGVDINFDAIKKLSQSNITHSIDLMKNLICCDSASPFRNNVFDLIVFNPPYLPSNKITDKTIDGGYSGIEITKAWFKSASKCLKEDGRIVFLSSSICDIKCLFNYIKKLGFEVNILNKKHLFFEELLIIEARPIH